MPPVYKISYVVTGEDHPGAILNSDHPPQVGDRVQLGQRDFEVVEVMDLIPSRGDFHFLHATLRPAPSSDS
jgi:hypothetical protein